MKKARAYLFSMAFPRSRDVPVGRGTVGAPIVSSRSPPVPSAGGSRDVWTDARTGAKLVEAVFATPVRQLPVRRLRTEGGTRWVTRRTHAPEPRRVRRRPTGPPRCGTSCWSATAEREKRPWWRLSRRPRARSPGRAGSRTARRSPTTTSSNTGSSAPCSCPSCRWPGTASRSTSWTPPATADFVGELRAGLRAADAALFVVSAADGVDGATKLVWEECAAVGHAAGVGRHSSRRRPRRFRRDDRGVPPRLRRRRPRRRHSALPAAARRGTTGRARSGGRPDRAAVPAGLRLLLGRTRREGARLRAPAADRAGPQPAHRGHHRRERGRDAHGPLPGRRGRRPQDPHRGPGEGGRPRRVPSGAGGGTCRGGRTAGAGHRGTAGAGHRRFPLAAGARGPTGQHPGRHATAAADLRPGRTAGGRGRQDLLRPLRRAGCRWSASSPEPCGPTRPCTSPGTD